MYEIFLSYPITTIEESLAIRKEIEALQASLIEIIGVEIIDEPAPPFKRFKPMSAAGRARVAAKSPAAVQPVKAGKKKRVVSAAARAKMAAAQKARWAKKNGASPAAVEPAVKGGKKKRTMSPEARERIAAAQRARWAKAKKA
jgi:hypothetical protein